jgi:mannose-6-phosphate isomerase-like protein (cupin superfamily)
MIAPIIVFPGDGQKKDRPRVNAAGGSFEIHEWSGSGPDYLHVHHADDEAWHILEGTLTFRFTDDQVEAPAGTTVFVPAGVPHTYFEAHGPTRYLIILTPRLRDLIAALHQTPYPQHAEVLRRFESDIIK